MLSRQSQATCRCNSRPPRKAEFDCLHNRPELHESTWLMAIQQPCQPRGTTPCRPSSLQLSAEIPLHDMHWNILGSEIFSSHLHCLSLMPMILLMPMVLWMPMLMPMVLLMPMLLLMLASSTHSVLLMPRLLLMLASSTLSLLGEHRARGWGPLWQ